MMSRTSRVFRRAAAASAAIACLALAGWTDAATTRIVRVNSGSSFNFDPSVLDITVGDTVLWTNTSLVTHDITSGSRATGVNTNNPYWASFKLNAFQSGSVTFSNIGSYPYICNQHVFITPVPAANPTQTGQVNVAAFNFPATVNLTSSANGAKLLAPAAVTLSASASDPDGTVTNLQIFVGANLVADGPGSPLSADLTGLSGGNYVLTARAVDNLGLAVTSAPVTLVVNYRVDYMLTEYSPAVLRIKPGESVLFTNLGGPHSVSGSGAEPFCGSAFISIPFCQVTLNSTGSFPYRCVFHSLSQASGMTGTVSVAVFNRSPTIELVSPSPNAVLVSPVNVTLRANAFDPDGSPGTVQFLNGTTLVNADGTPPYSFTLTNLAPGSYSFTARVADNAGLRATSAPVNITVVGPIQLSGPALGLGGFQFQYTATPGQPYVVEGSGGSEGPAPFVPLATNVAGSNLVSFADPGALGRSNRAYRVFLKPSP